jgi:hypothetical protein
MQPEMIDLISAVLAVAAGSPAQLSDPVQACEIQTQAWCLVQSGTLFDVTSIDYNKRVWTLRNKMFESASVRILEDRGCSSYPSDFQRKSEGLHTSTLDGSQKYVIKWSLHKDDSCNLYIEIPVVNNTKNIIAYEVMLRDLKACLSQHCDGPNLAATPSGETAHIRRK